MIKIGITGQVGFIGTHLYNTIGLYPDKYERIPFEDSYFQNQKRLEDFVRHCDVIVHLAALNRHNSPEILFNTNINLVKKLIQACEKTQSNPHIIFSSSSQEERDNHYGKSKKEGRRLLEIWAERNNTRFTGLVIPNVFGPFGRPYYNSVVATFSHQLARNETPNVDIDSNVKLIYVGDLVNEIIKQIELPQLSKENSAVINLIEIPFTSEIRVSELLLLLKEFKNNYFVKGEIPSLDDSFRRNLFNTFLCYIDHPSFFPFNLKLNSDQRGSFVEIIKLRSGGQVSFSTTLPGVTRGNHFHTRKTERFAVIKGTANINLRKIGTDKVISYSLDGSQPAYVDMPIWFTHNITNTGNEELFTIFWINEHYNLADPDTFFEVV